jgi:hypothetical protein
MQEQQLYEYAVIRVVPRVEREEFINVGVILYCRRQRYLQCLYTLDAARLQALHADVDLPLIERYLQAFTLITTGSKNGGPIAKLDVASRFRWLTATRSTMLQTSKVHPAFCAEPQQALQRLFEQLVL